MNSNKYKIGISILILCGIVITLVYMAGPFYPGATVLVKAQAPDNISKSILSETYIGSVQNLGFSALSTMIKKTPDQNQLISPLSFSMCLTMAMSGATQGTYNELKSALGYGDMTDTEIYNQNKGAFEKSYLTEDLKIRIANAIWFDKDYGIEPAFLEGCRDNFYADIFAQDFNDASSLLRNVNTWVDHKSEGEIQSILDKVDPNDKMYLLNSVYFEGKWENAFDKDKTKDMDFNLSNNSKIKSPFMTTKKNVKYKGTEQFESVAIPYKGEMYMVVALPKEGMNLSDLLSDKEAMKRILNFNDWTYSNSESRSSGTNQENPDYNEAKVTMPKFKFEKETDLIPVLQDLGVESAFTDNADFTKMDPKNMLYISAVKQKTFISVDEKKTVAIAFTLTIMTNKSAIVEEKHITFDRPFIFAIVDDQGLPLFIGTIENPAIQ